MEDLVMFGDAFRGRRVLVTGHTGFKGSWLTHWLLSLGADVVGVSLEPPTHPSLFEILGLADRCRHHIQDVRDCAALDAVLAESRIEVAFHLAAQALVRTSYRDPQGTFATNVLGTVNLLEVLRKQPRLAAVVVVTSDKCYENQSWEQPYRETDALGGHDPYSASKAAAELVVAGYRRSFYAPAGIPLATARAGNVIGGGDWAADRLMSDFVTSIARNQPLTLRNPHATRPWQHVLEPLSGYLCLTSRLLSPEGAEYARAWNFGPDPGTALTVGQLAQRLIDQWGQGSLTVVPDPSLPETHQLRLDSSQAREWLAWRPVWAVERAIDETLAWYRTHYGGGDAPNVTDRQLEAYATEARQLGLPWAQHDEGQA